MALLTVHHWTDVAAGIAELRRVARRIVILTWDQHVTERFWLSREYLPQLSAYDDGAVTIETVLDLLGGAEVRPLPVPHDCTDGFLGAFWRRPHCYLDQRVRAGISTMAATEAAPASSAFAGTSNRAIGPAATPIFCSSTSSTSATAC
jgi:hypothetical protein